MPNYRDEPIEFDCELKNETDKAWLLVIESNDYWIPKSLGEFTPKKDMEDVDGIVMVPTWWAEKEGLA